jgi:hypothetical protein
MTLTELRELLAKRTQGGYAFSMQLGLYSLGPKNEFGEPDVIASEIKIVDAQSIVALNNCAEELLDVATRAEEIANSLTCYNFHHRKEDQHTAFRPCPPLERYKAALAALTAKLEEMK